MGYFHLGAEGDLFQEIGYTRCNITAEQASSLAPVSKER